MKPLSRRKRTVYFLLFCLLFVIFIPFIIFYAIGYRFNSKDGIVQTGGIFINSDDSKIEVYMDQKLVKKTGFFRKDYYIQDLTPGEYSIMVSEKDHNTWRKTLQVLPTLVSEASPFLLPTIPAKREILPYQIPASAEISATGTLVTTEATTTATSTKKTVANPEYTAVVKLFATTTTFTSRTDLPVVAPAAKSATSSTSTKAAALFATSTATSSEPKINQKITVYKDGNKIVAEWLGNKDEAPYYFCMGTVCTDTITVYEAKKNLAHFDFFPGHTNLIIIADEAGIQVTELDTRGGQNIQPLYVVPGATFRVGQGGNIYVKDKTRYFALGLE